MQYKIIHIPASLHLPSNNPELDQMCPLDILLHVKRVRRSSVKGKTELPVILCNENEKHTDGIPNNVLQLISTHHLSPFNAKM
ncbi:uncharacterized protein [Elaeis guineensis]|uniref:uncharacterized protein isoform X2 n=1 Tax=Elaeis guineensis var. tenera TaxID=51953 RepID=UPI003C6CC598